MNYVGRVSPPILPVPPEGALYWDFVNGNLYGSLPGTGVWGLIGGNATLAALQSLGVPATLFKSFKVNQTAALSSIALVPAASNPGGMWRLSYVATVTTADTTSFTLGGTTGFQDTFTNGNGDHVVKTSDPTAPAISAVNTTGSAVSGCKIGYTEAGTAIIYAFGYTAGTGNGAYDIAVFAEYLGA